MVAVLVVHAVIAAVVFPSRRLGRRAFAIAAIAPLTALVWLITRLSDVVNGRVIHQELRWVPELGLSATLRLDAFSALLVLLIAAIGVLVCLFSMRYYAPSSERLGRNAGLIVFFAGAMLLVVLADNLMLLYTGWELTSVASYLLIGNEHEKPHARAAALQALLVTSFGGLAMFAGFVVLGRAAGSFSLEQILVAPPTGRRVDVALILILVGAFTKSAQYPFSFWLPGAMAAPTPVSAYLHSATMVKAGIYLIGRLAPAFATTGPWRPLVVSVGTVTMLCGGLRALRQYDLKLLLAHSTVSQLGLLAVLFGLGTPAASGAACLLLAAHAVFKATLFLGVGVIDHEAGTRDIRKLTRPRTEWRVVVAASTIAAASMAGVPLLFGFVAKEAALGGVLRSGVGGARWITAGVVVGSALTAAYAARFVSGMLGREGGEATETTKTPFRAPSSIDRSRRPSTMLVAPVAILSIVSVLLGVAPALAQSLWEATSGAIQPLFEAPHLALWHGFNAELALSATALTGGALLFGFRRRVEPVLALGAVVPSGGRAYAAVLRSANRVATRVTGSVQNGSLPIYAGVTLLTAALLPGWAMLRGATMPRLPAVVGRWPEICVAVAILGAALAAAIVRRRFSAALFLGVTGYSMAGLFAVRGAPDLALTQVAIETLSTVLFVLVLRRLPDRFERTSTRQRRIGRLAISAVVGITVAALAIVSRAARQATPVSDQMIDLSLPEGHGRNVVNVILVDIRGFDTMGEITVLAAAAIGAVALARVGRRRAHSRREP